jgi:hypothetical protein
MLEVENMSRYLTGHFHRRAKSKCPQAEETANLKGQCDVEVLVW